MPHSARKFLQTTATFCQEDSPPLVEGRSQLYPTTTNDLWDSSSNISALLYAPYAGINYEPMPVWDGQPIQQLTDHLGGVEQPNFVQQPLGLSVPLTSPEFETKICPGVPTLPYNFVPPTSLEIASDISSPSGVERIDYISTANRRNEASIPQAGTKILTNSDRDAKPRTGKLRERFESGNKKP